MKKSSIISMVFLLISAVSFSQENAANTAEIENYNEIKLNMTNLIGFKWFDVTYERTLNEESSFGIGLLTKIGSDLDDGDGLDAYRTFSITPFYRQYFSKKYAQGFFVEGFAMLHSGKDTSSYDYNPNNGIYTYTYEKYTDLAIGVSTGAKFLTKRGFIAEIYLGIGRDFLGKSDIDVVGRGGVSLGYRF